MADKGAPVRGHSQVNAYPFSRLCHFMQELEELSGPAGPSVGRPKLMQKGARVKALFDDVRKKVGTERDLYPIVRLLLPFEDKERTFNLAENKLNQLYRSVLNADEKTSKEIENWKTPGMKVDALRGDMADVLSFYLKPRCTHSVGVTVGELNSWLDALCALNRIDNREKVRDKEKTRLLNTILMKLDYKEHKWLIRLILKNMRLGCKAEKVLGAYHESAVPLFAQAACLADVCAKCAKAGYRYNLTNMTPFTPVLPMLANPISVEKAGSKMAGDFLCEPKLDGERILLHLVRNSDGTQRFELYTRKRNLFTSKYENDVSSFKPVLEKAILPSVKSCILDGEMLVWDSEERKHLPFGANRTMNVSHKEGTDKHLMPAYFVFDILYLNATNLTATSLRERKELLKEHIKPEGERLQLIESTEIDKADPQMLKTGAIALRISAILDEALSAGHEGLMLKSLSQGYEANARSWIKIKPDYIAGSFRTLDVLVVGGYYGAGAAGRHWKSQGVSAFLLALLAPKSTPIPGGSGGHPPVFSFSKVGTGYSAVTLKEMRRKLDPVQVPWDKKKGAQGAPPFMCGWKPGKSDDIPDVWYPPRESIVLELKAFSIVKAAEMWRAGICLRFPRVEKWRQDKNWETAATFTDVMALHEELRASGRTLSTIGARDGQSSGRGQPVAKKLKAVQQVIGGRLPADIASIQVKLNLFEKAEVVVLTEIANMDELIRLAASLGATSSKNIGYPTRYVIVDSELIGGKEQARKAAQEARKSARSGNGEGNLKRAQEVVKQATSTRVPKKADAPAAGAIKSKAKTAKQEIDWENVDVLTAEWLQECRHIGKLAPIEPRFALHMSKRSTLARDEVMDEWGDRYFEETSADELRASMRLVRAQRLVSGVPTPNVHETLLMSGLPDHMVLKLDTPPESTLRHPRRCVALVPSEFAQGVPTSVDPLRGKLACEVAELRLLGALVVHEPTDTVTTVVLPEGEGGVTKARKLRPEFRKLWANGGLVQTISYVRSSWVDACKRELEWVDEAAYLIALS